MISADPALEVNRSEPGTPEFGARQVFIEPARGSYQVVQKLHWMPEGNGHFEIQAPPPEPGRCCGIDRCTYRKAKAWACKTFFMSTIAMVLLCLVAGIMGLMVNFGQRGIAAARTFSGNEQGFLHHRDDQRSYGAQEKKAKERWEHSARGKETSVEDARPTEVALRWVKRDGLPEREGADIVLFKDHRHTLEEVKTACQSNLDCIGFAYWPRKGWWFPKQTGTGFDPATANYSQKHHGELWEWHYLSDRVHAQAIHHPSSASTTEHPRHVLAVRRTPAEEQALKKWQSIIKQSHQGELGKPLLKIRL